MENSIEEALKKLSTGKKIKIYELLRTFKREGIENFVTTRKKYVDVILSDYKRVLKENEQLRTEANSLKEENEELEEINNELEAEKNEAIRRYNFETIPIKKVKDKIEELKSNPLKIKQNDKYYYETHAYNKIIISVLQELIEEREEK